ncbi:hypothetical protein BDZ89DRAFT_1038397 [Hymenopellis radicata]|nr:hypothetical protein BDZ89DRAFT_1038397 [Hymenopellis radicata]
MHSSPFAGLAEMITFSKSDHSLSSSPHDSATAAIAEAADRCWQRGPMESQADLEQGFVGPWLGGGVVAKSYRPYSYSQHHRAVTHCHTVRLRAIVHVLPLTLTSFTLRRNHDEYDHDNRQGHQRDDDDGLDDNDYTTPIHDDKDEDETMRTRTTRAPQRA